MNAREVKDALRARHPALNEVGGPGAWTCIEEWMKIDLLAVCAWANWQGCPRYARIGYEVKVSRSDYKRELVNPRKRARAVAFTHEFYFAVPLGLLKDEERTWEPPPGFDQSLPLERTPCPGAYGASCSGGRLIHMGVVDRRTTAERRLYSYGRVDFGRAYSPECPTCRGLGYLAESPAVRAGAPALWVPADVGLIVVHLGKARLAKKAPRRETQLDRASARPWQVGMTDADLAGLIRWVSARPDPRHHGLVQAPVEAEADVTF